MNVEEWRGKFVLTEPIEAEWQRNKLPGATKVVEIACRADAEVWALAGGSFLLKYHPGDGWTVDAQIAGQVNTVAVLQDGTVVAGGEGLFACRNGSGEWTAQKAPARLMRVWGASPECVYALGERTHGRGRIEESGIEATWVSCGLFHFDGESWSEINLAAADVHGMFVDGACDADGYGWIVGTHQTHSCMARGKGTEWEPDGCGSWYLYHVHIDRDGNGYALGGDGLWHLQGGVWLAVGGFGSDIGWPLALSAVNGQPWTLDAGGGAVWSDQPVFEVGIYLAGLWARLPLPKAWRPDRSGGTFAISECGEVFFGIGNDVWQTTLLSKVDQVAVPPRRLTPEDDPQLASTEPLVGSWHRLEGSWKLEEWSWYGDGVVGALARHNGSVLAHWRDLSQERETLSEFDFQVEGLSVAPRGNVVAIIPAQIQMLGSRRRLMLMDLETGKTQELSLPEEFVLSEPGPSIFWSPDGLRCCIDGSGSSDGGDCVQILIFRVFPLQIQQVFKLPERAYPYRWDGEGIVFLKELTEPRPFSGAWCDFLDPESGEVRSGEYHDDVSPSGKYRVSLRDTSIEITTIADGSLREFVPTTGGVLDSKRSGDKPGIQHARWVGDRLELPAKLLGPVHLDLDSLELHYAHPVRAAGEPRPLWHRGGHLALRRGAAGEGSKRVDSERYSWGGIERR